MIFNNLNIIARRFTWTLRRLRLNVTANALVLEVGSGGNPYPRANVLLDAYEETRERHWAELVHDRPTVLSFGENLPFKDKAFDYVIASHVLEHTPNPERFLSELERVAKAGYIETPDAFMERINPYKDHRLEVTVRDGSLIIRKKKAWINDPDLVELYENRAKAIITAETIPQHADEFHMRYFWKDKINFHVVNPEVDATWAPPPVDRYARPKNGALSKIRLQLLNLVRIWLSQKSRNKTLNILSLLRCPKCYSENMLKKSAGVIECVSCETRFKVDKNIYHMG